MIPIANLPKIGQSAPCISVGHGDVKLDVEVIRSLLLHVEKHAERPIADLTEIELDGSTGDEITYHVVLAHEAGLLSATIEEVPDSDDSYCYVYTVHRLTMAGHEFLETVRDPAAWRAVKHGAKQAGVSTLKAIVGFATAYIDQKIRMFAGAGPFDAGS